MNTVSIWKDLVLLKWDGVSPPNAPKNSIYNHADVIHFWPYLKGYMKWYKSMNCFGMSFSKQNMKRLHAQFGPISITKGKERIADLKRTDAEIYDMFQAIQKVKKLPFERLPDYTYKMPPLGEYQHRGVVFLRNIKRAPLFADCGCLAGDSIISVSRNKNSRKVKISDLFKEFHRRDKRTPTKVRSLCGEGIRLNKIGDVKESGIKDVYKISLSDKKSIKATKDHLIMTDSGWVQAGDLKIGSMVMVDTLTKHKEHAKLHTRGYYNFNHGVPEYSEVTSISYAGSEMTYDICCQAPHHNFVANGIVVHNSGKTYMVATSTEMQIKYGEVPSGKTLICGKLSTLETGWLEDIQKFTDLTAHILWLPSGKKNRKEKILEMLEDPADIYIINHDGLRIYKDELKQQNFKKVVVDESTILKSFRGMDPRIRGGVFAKALMEVAHAAEYKVIMSGTPASNGPEDLWGQYAFLDPKGIMLEPSFQDFRERYYTAIDLRPRHLKYVINKDTGKFAVDSEGNFIKKPMTGRTPRKFVPKKGTVVELNATIANSAYRLKIRDHIKDLPDLSIIPRKLIMDFSQSGHYKDMEKKLKVEIDDTRITVPMQLNKMMKLRQITGGFIIDNNQKPHAMKVNPKMDELDSILCDEIEREDKVVIFAEYRWEIESILQRYKKHGIVSVYGGNTSVKNLKAIKSFREDPKIRLIVMHPKSAAHGITLTMAHYLIFYSFSHSAEDNYQAIKRIERAGQKNAMFVYYLMMSKTIDTAMKEVLNLKNENQSKLIDEDELSVINQKELDDELLDIWRKNG